MKNWNGLLAAVLFSLSLFSAAAQTVTVTTPNGGQTWTAGSTYSITWTISGSTASINYQLVALSTDGGSTYNNISVAQTPATRSFNWTIPAGTSTSQARIRVRALDVNAFILAQDASDSTFTISAPATIPASPTSLTASGGTSSIGLSWQDNANNEQGFYIERKIGAGGTWGLYASVGANVTSYTDTGVVAGNTYYYRVYAYNATGPSQFYSNEASAALTGAIPASPTSLTAVGGTSSIVLAWQDNANNEQGFRIERKIGAGGTWGLYTTVGANVTGYTDTGVVAGNTYYYRVYAYNAAGASQFYSNEASASLQTVPASPTTLTAVGGASSIALNWQDNANNEQGFYIERKIGAGGTFAYYAAVGANVTTYTDSSVVVGNIYYYRVYAYNATGPSQFYSNEASAAPTGAIPGSPTSLTAVGGTSSIVLGWQDNANNEQGFRIERKIGAGGTWGLYTTVGANVTGYTDTGVVAGNTYFYRVYAYNAAGASQFYSNEASASLQLQTVPASPTLLTAAGGTSSVGLAWQDNANNEQGFYIERKIGVGGTWGLYAAVGANVTGYTDTGVVAGNTYYYRVYAYNAVGPSPYYSNEAFATVTSSTVTLLQNGVPVGNLSGAQGNQRIYKIIVPSGQAKLDISIAGGTGDCDLYVRFGSAPTTSSYDYRPYTGGNNETVSVNNPASGDWYIMLNGYSSYSGVTLLAGYSTVISTVATPQISPGGGGYNNSVTVTMSTATAGASIYYTLNGSDPTTSSTFYGGAFTLTANTTVKANAFKSGMTASAIASQSYTITTSVTTLQNNVPVGSLSGPQGSQKLYKITVPSGQTKLDISIAGGTGDCDLYVRFGSAPTSSSYDYRPYTGGNNETVSVNNPASGDWYVMLNGYNDYSGVTLLAKYESVVVTNPILLQNNTPVTGLAGSSGSEAFYKIVVPFGQSRVEIRTFGGSGDCDLYVKLGSQPTTSSYTYRSVLAGNDENVMVLSPGVGTWYILLKGNAAFSGITLNTRYGPTGGSTLLKATADALNFNFFQRYAAGKKYLFNGAGDLSIGTVVTAGIFEFGPSIGMTIYADLDDYIGVTPEGWNGNWVTLWVRGHATAFGAGFNYSAGVEEREFDSVNLPDMEFALEESLLDLNVGPLMISALTLSSANGVQPGDISFDTIGFGINIGNIQSPSKSVEVQRDVLDNALANAFSPGLPVGLLGINMMNYVFDLSQSSKVDGNMQVAWRLPLRSTDNDKTDDGN